MSKRKGQGFLWAFIFAVVSFFIIFLLMPDKSEHFFGTSVGHKSSKELTKTVSEVSEAVSDINLNKVVKGK